MFTELLPSNNRRLHMQTHRRWKGCMKYATEMGPCAMIYIPNFIRIGRGIEKLTGVGGIHRLTDSKVIL
jgi:hypothetical protein